MWFYTNLHYIYVRITCLSDSVHVCMSVGLHVVRQVCMCVSSTTLRGAVLHCTPRYSPPLHSEVQSSTTLRGTVLHCTLRYSPPLHSEVQSSTALRGTVLHCTPRYSPPLHSKVQSSTALRGTILHYTPRYSPLLDSKVQSWTSTPRYVQSHHCTTILLCIDST